MRSKVMMLMGLVVLVVACAAPAAQAEVVSLEASEGQLEPEYPVEAESVSFKLTTGWGPLYCSWGHSGSKGSEGDIKTVVAENGTDPAVLTGTSGGDFGCILNGMSKYTGSAQVTGPIEFSTAPAESPWSGYRAGEFPVKFTLKIGATTCTWAGTLGLDVQEGGSYAGFDGNLTGPCAAGTASGELYFHLPNLDPVKFLYF
ncbi:MAG TPA: hypothetical protein VI039_06405 [Solirubrobacterales bacterium]